MAGGDDTDDDRPTPHDDATDDLAADDTSRDDLDDRDNLDDRDDVDDDDELDEGDGEDGRRGPRALSLVLALVGMILIPLGLILVFLSVTEGNTAKQTTLTVPVTVPGATVPTPAALAGRWNILAGPDSWVGYSMKEEFLTAETPNTAEGRTHTVDGGVVIGETEVPAVAINADMRALQSDDPKRDNTLRTQGLETDAFPNASFALTEPIPLTSVPPYGRPVDVVAQGELTLHGVTKPVEVHLQVQLIPGDAVLIEISGSIPIVLADYGIDPPNIANTISVQDHGEAQFHLRLARAPDEVAAHPATAPGTTPATPTGTAR